MTQRAGTNSTGGVSDSSWAGYLKNCGVWTGRRALVNSRGKVLLDVPVSINTECFKTPEGEPFVLWRTVIETASGTDSVEEEWSREELGYFGALTEDASFSTGNDTFDGRERFSVDNCLFGDMDDSFRVRSTFAYDWEGRLTGVVSSRERKSPAVPNSSTSGDDIAKTQLSTQLSTTKPFIEPAAWRSPTVLLDYTVGSWRGSGVVLSAKTRTTRTIESAVDLALEAGGVLLQRSRITIGRRPGLVVESSARMDENTALFSEANMQLMFLPGGVSVSCPIRIWPGISFNLELCLLARPNLRRRLIRCYDEDARWIQTVFITELRVG